MDLVRNGSTEAPKAAGLNCLQSLISENTIKEFIYEYIEEIAIETLAVFTAESWKIR